MFKFWILWDTMGTHAYKGPRAFHVSVREDLRAGIAPPIAIYVREAESALNERNNLYPF